MNIVRDLLLFFESDGITKYPAVDPDVAGEHLVLMQQAGLIDGERTEGPTMIFPPDGRTVSQDGTEFYLFPLTWAGHDFIAAARDQKLWNKAMAVVGGMAIGTMKAYLQNITHEALGISDNYKDH